MNEDEWFEYEERCRGLGLVARRSIRGDTFAFQVQCYQSGTQQIEGYGQNYSRLVAPTARPMVAPAPSNSPLNLTGYFAQFTAKYQTSDQDSQAVAIAKSSGATPTYITFPRGVTSGLLQVQVGPLLTITLADGPTRLTYDVWVCDASGNKTTVERGAWVIFPSASRATAPS